MKILYLIQYFVTRQGSWSTRSYEFARRLIDKGHQVTVITLPGYLPEKYKQYKRITRLDIDGVPTILIPVAYSNDMGFQRRMIQFIKFALLASWISMREKADLVYASSGPLTIVIPGIAAKLWQRIPMVFEVRDLWPRLPIAIGVLKGRFVIWLARALEWVAYHSAKHIIALSPGMKEGVLERGISADRVTVIPNSSDIDLFDVPPEQGQAFRETLGIPASVPLVVYAGTFGLMNNLSYLIDVAAAMRDRLPECRFLLIGFGAEKTKITEKAHSLGLLDQTVFIRDSVPKHQVPAVLSAATVTISTFLPIKEMWDNSANKFFDSLAAGKPIAINYGGWQAELIAEQGIGVQLSERDPVLAAEALSALLESPERLTRAGRAARELAISRFNRDMLAAQQETLLRSLVKTGERAT